MKKLLLLGLVLNVSLVFAGSESGGGGGTVLIEDKPILIDYFTIINNVKELPRSQSNPSRITFPKKYFSKIKNEAAIGLQRVLDRWENETSDLIVKDIRKTFIKDINFAFTKGSLEVPKFYIAPVISQEKVVVAAAHGNTPLNIGLVRINVDVWNKMDLTSQVGLLLHETLRHTQRGQLVGYGDVTLQNLTAMYMLCRPDENLAYVADIYYGEKFAKYDLKKAWAYDFKAIIESDCHRN